MQKAEFPASAELKIYTVTPDRVRFFSILFIFLSFSTPLEGPPSPDKPPGTFGIYELCTVEIIIEREGKKTQLSKQTELAMRFSV